MYCSFDRNAAYFIFYLNAENAAAVVVAEVAMVHKHGLFCNMVSGQ